MALEDILHEYEAYKKVAEAAELYGRNHDEPDVRFKLEEAAEKLEGVKPDLSTTNNNKIELALREFQAETSEKLVEASEPEKSILIKSALKYMTPKDLTALLSTVDPKMQTLQRIAEGKDHNEMAKYVLDQVKSPRIKNVFAYLMRGEEKAIENLYSQYMIKYVKARVEELTKGEDINKGKIREEINDYLTAVEDKRKEEIDKIESDSKKSEEDKKKDTADLRNAFNSPLAQVYSLLAKYADRKDD